MHRRKAKYWYNSRTCNYELSIPSRWDTFKSILTSLTSSLVMGVFMFWGYASYTDSPKEKKLERENVLLRSYYDKIQQEVDKSQHILAHLREQDHQLYRIILEMDPPPHGVPKKSLEDTKHPASLVADHTLITKTMQKVAQLKHQLYVQSKSYEALKKRARENGRRLAAMPAIQPLSNKDLRRVSSPFGMRIHPIHKIPSMHEGVDFAAPRGAPVYATGNGVVKRTRKSRRGYGNQIVVDHGYGYQTSYSHLQDFTVIPGQKVSRGQCIGHVGNTGTSTSPHLHYEVIKNNKKVDPAHYFSNDLDAQQYDMLLELAARKIRTSS